MSISLFHDNVVQLQTSRSQRICILIKTHDPIYFTERVVWKKDTSIYLFSLILFVLFPLLIILLLVNVFLMMWKTCLFWFFKEKPLISPAEVEKRLHENALMMKMTLEEKEKLFSKKNLPLGL
ncbi:hypothetical protein [Beggiatoa leptomitoformis]|uniref:Uncharacterized protein n=1 Tax=Beggiatoa leptomitoformis TaxID=288004 RepID=A0A2N9YAV7_9GAMM|nr:hypothetical protein [Beggiatoa leptomitoformis]ALG67020.1 hypothetical protein AL038_03925 [Beggiatoa leptomitoformis]AUI67603.1 hypothetical protein BLE401_02085 [Beggiatoa leptomitoformis]